VRQVEFWGTTVIEFWNPLPIWLAKFGQICFHKLFCFLSFTLFAHLIPWMKRILNLKTNYLKQCLMPLDLPTSTCLIWKFFSYNYSINLHLLNLHANSHCLVITYFSNEYVNKIISVKSCRSLGFQNLCVFFPNSCRITNYKS
jgi:hypothetical protein